MSQTSLAPTFVATTLLGLAGLCYYEHKKCSQLKQIREKQESDSQIQLQKQQQIIYEIGGEERLHDVIDQVETSLIYNTYLKEIYSKKQRTLLKQYILKYLLLNFGYDDEYYGYKQDLQTWLQQNEKKMPKLSKDHFEIFESEFMFELFLKNIKKEYEQPINQVVQKLKIQLCCVKDNNNCNN